MKAATEAQEIVAETRPSVNSLSTLSYYQLFTGDFKAAEEAERRSGVKLSGTKFEREKFENQYEEVEKNAREFDKQLKLEKVQSESGGEGGKEALEKPSLGGLGGATLGTEGE